MQYHIKRYLDDAISDSERSIENLEWVASDAENSTDSEELVKLALGEARIFNLMLVGLKEKIEADERAFPDDARDV